MWQNVSCKRMFTHGRKLQDRAIQRDSAPSAPLQPLVQSNHAHRRFRSCKIAKETAWNHKVFSGFGI
ncbi:MAG: hypothetical protein ABI995_14845, partial [Acidobacteriota bacterium]